VWSPERFEPTLQFKPAERFRCYSQVNSFQTQHRFFRRNGKLRKVSYLSTNVENVVIIVCACTKKNLLVAVKLMFSLSGMATPIAANHIHKNINFKTQPASEVTRSRILLLRKIPLVLNYDNVFLELFNKDHYHGKITTCLMSYMCSVATKSETWKPFLQITIPALILKSYNPGKIHFIWHSWAFRPGLGYIFASFHFECFGKTREALRDLTWAPSQKNLRLDKKFLEITNQSFIPKC